MKVLLADDYPDQLTLRSMLLERCGFEPLAADNARSASDLATEHRPACAIVDLRMPTEQQGLALIRDLRALSPAMHIFVLTGGDRSHLASLVESELVDEILPKGSSTSVLLSRLKALKQS